MNKRTKGESLFPMWLFFVYLGVLLLMSGNPQRPSAGRRTMGLGKRDARPLPHSLLGRRSRRADRFHTVPHPHHLRRTHCCGWQKPPKRWPREIFRFTWPPSIPPTKTDYLDQMFLDFNKMVEELGSIETLKTDFFSDVSHEFKSPLAVISGSADLLQKSPALTDRDQKEVDSIRDATRRLADLIQNMLKLNKLEKQTIRPAPSVFDVCAQVCSCAVQFEDQWEKKDLDFEADLEDSADVYADPGLTELVWNNLLSNAIKFTPPGGTITLAQKTMDHWVEVSVRDTGCGMTEETIRHIFDKFYQGDTSHATQGNGLGLALVKRILELSGGEIRVESQPGKGSVFTVWLPRPDGQEAQG